MDSLKIEDGIGYNHNNIQNKYNNTQNNSIDKVFKIEYMNSTDSKDLNNHRTSVPAIIAKDEQEMKTLYTLIKKFKDREERIVECEFVMRYEISLYSMGPLDTTLENTVCNVNELYNSNMFFGKKPHEEIFSWIRSFKDFSIINNSVMNITQMKGIILLAKTADLMQRPNKKTVFTSTLCEKDMIGNTHTLGFPNIFKILFKINFIKNSLNNFFSTDKQSRFGKHSKICIIPKTFHKFLDAVELCSTCKLSTTIKKDKQERTINQSVITYKDYKSLLDVLIKSFVVNLLQACDEVAGEYYDYFISPQKMKDMFCNEYNNKNLISFLGKDCVDNITYVLYKRVCADNKKYNFINIMDHFDFFSSFLNDNIINSPFINNESLYNITDCSTCNEVKQYINKEQSRISNVFGTIFNEMKELLSRDDDEIINEFHNEWNIYHDKYTINNLLKRFKQEKN